MDVIEAIRKRRSIRKYVRKELSEELLKKLIEVAKLAPSAKNQQPWKLVIVKDDSIKEKLVEACMGQEFVGECSIFVAGVGDPKFKWHVVDTAIALEHVALEAVELGLGSCWIGAFEEDEIKEILKIPKEMRVVACMTIGYPAEKPEQRPRKSVRELVSFNIY
ncbi:MAG: nitroreductase family protein [Candidatus Aenigmarchaeota archaeon]|nr:nitroreductase family protein [Candidatus Aenigmarchaeota archaeon]